jgi:hypothetical protein
VREGLHRQGRALLEREAAARDRGEDVVVAQRRGDDGDVGVVLRGRAHHGGSTDVDLLDAVVDAGTRRDGLLERVQVHDDEFEGQDAKVLELLAMRVLAQVGEQSAVDVRMQGLDPAVERLREARHVADRRDGNTRSCDGAGGRARRHDLDPGEGEPPREVLQAGLVVDRDQGPAHMPPAVVAHGFSPISRASVSTSRGRSICLIRSCSAASSSPGRTSTARWARIGPVSTPWSTRCTVQPVTVTP